MNPYIRNIVFTSARLKLTAWYLLITLLISSAFSVVIYRMLTAEFDHFAKVQRYRFEHQIEALPAMPPDMRLPMKALFILDPDLVAEIKRRVAWNLVLVNSGILVIAGALGYFLAGRTLKPIQEMVEEHHRFISDASHELRTPLTALKSALEVHLRDPKLKLVEAKRLLSDNLEDVNKLQRLSDSLLQLAQFKEPKQRAYFKPISIREIAQVAIQQVEPLAAQKQIQILSTIENVTFEGDFDKLNQLVVILIDNAIKYSPKGSSIALSAKQQDKSLELVVKDGGIGIRKKDQPYIFDRFFRADQARTNNGVNGYGLGLSIAKQIVDQHEGTIKVNSKPGKGSVFIVRLPL